MNTNTGKKFKCCSCPEIIQEKFDLVYRCECTPNTVYCYICYRNVLFCKICKSELINEIDKNIAIDEDLKIAMFNSLKETTILPSPTTSKLFPHMSGFSPLQPLLCPKTLQHFTNWKTENNEPLYNSAGNPIREDTNKTTEIKYFQNSFNSDLTSENDKNPFKGFESSFEKIKNPGKFTHEDTYNNYGNILDPQLSLSVIKLPKECIVCTCVSKTTDITSCSSCKQYICKFCYISARPFCNPCFAKIKTCSKCTLLLEEDDMYKCSCFFSESPTFHNTTNPHSVYKNEIFCEECTQDEICTICKNYYSSTNYYTCQSCKKRKHRRNGKIYFCLCNSPALTSLSYPKLFLCSECDKSYDVTCPNCDKVFNDAKIGFEKDEFKGYIIPTSLYISCIKKYNYFYNSDSCNADLEMKKQSENANINVNANADTETIQINGYTCV